MLISGNRPERVAHDCTHLVGRADPSFSLDTLARDDLDRAAALFLEGLRFSLDASDRANIAYCLEGLAAIAVQRERPLVAARLLGGAHALFETVGGRVYTYRPDRALREQTEAAARERLDASGWEAAWSEGAAMPMPELIAMGTALTNDVRGIERGEAP